MTAVQWTNTKIKKGVIIIVLVLIVAGSGTYLLNRSSQPEGVSQTQTQWFESASTGKLTQDMSYFAVSARTSPVIEMKYPYNEITASIGYGCDKTGEWMYVAFSEPPNIANTETEEELHRFVSKIVFDKETEEYEVTQKFGERFLHFRDDNKLLNKLLASSSMTFEVNWYREGPARFVFPLDGSAEIINKVQDKCAEFETEKN